MNLGAFLSDTARRHPTRPALTFDGRTTTYAELNDRVDALAAGFLEAGLATGDRVVMWLPNGPALMETFFACWKLGLVAVPVNARLGGQEVAYHVEDCNAAALVRDGASHMGAGGSALPLTIVVGGGRATYEGFVARHMGAGDQTVEVDDAAPAWLFYTSGTTGRPKGATLTHGNLTFMVVSWCADLYNLQPEDVVLHCAPLSHGAGFLALAAIARGAHNVVHARFDPAMVFADVARQGVTSVWLVPTQIRMLLDHQGLHAADLASLRTIVYGGSPISVADLEEALDRFGPILCQLYGQGEAPMTISYLRPQDHTDATGDDSLLMSAGFPRTGIEVRVVDEDDTPLGPEEVGEIAVRGPVVMAGYWDRTEATNEALRGGWLHTGDLGRIDLGGRLHVLDRLKDLIITGGSNVYAREVEDVLLRHPCIREAAVVGTPHRIWGEAVTAAIVTRSAVEAAEIEAHCRAHLADYKRPKRIAVVDELPKNSYGKVLKRELRTKFSVDEAAG